MQVLQELDLMGGMAQCLTSRENILYCVDVLRENVDRAMAILAESVLIPKLTMEELEESQNVLSIIPTELPSEMISRDAVQRAAYLNSPLSNHHYCPVDKIEHLKPSLVQNFRANFLYGSNCVLAGAGIDHETFHNLAAKYFSALPGKGLSAERYKRPPSKYTGGAIKEERVLKEPFVRLALAFEMGGWHDSTIVVACVLQQLMGGGSSFSAGGPGKGMYSRLYRQVLNRYHWVESAECFLNVHDDSGIFGIDGSCSPQSIPDIFGVFLEQLIKLAKEPVEDIELSRAKNMLKSNLLMQLESRLVLCEDIAKQFLTYNKRDSSAEIILKIDRVTQEDIVRFARRILSTPPSVGCAGEDVSYLPEYIHLANYTKKITAFLR